MLVSAFILFERGKSLLITGCVSISSCTGAKPWLPLVLRVPSRNRTCGIQFRKLAFYPLNYRDKCLGAGTSPSAAKVFRFVLTLERIARSMGFEPMFLPSEGSAYPLCYERSVPTVFCLGLGFLCGNEVSGL